MHTLLKICGITRLDDARFCAGAGADFLGFVQYPDSPRYITPAAAAEIIGWLHGPEPVGVFVNESAETVNRVAAEAGFSYVQLHGTEPPELCAEIERPIIKAFHVMHDAAAEQIRWLMDPYVDVVRYFLLDTHRTSLWGGTGESFNWRLARELSRDYPLFLAGGIHAGNVQEALETMRPLGIDLSSGVEEFPGVKSLDRLQEFFDVFRRLEEAPESQAQ